MKNILFILGIPLILMGCSGEGRQDSLSLEVSENGRYFLQGDQPFFWLGDTGWLMLTRLDRQQAATYLRTRSEQGFNVIQVMLLHSLDAVNVYGDSALKGASVAHPRVTAGNSFSDSTAYDYWDHVEYALRLAEELDMYLAMVPVWGSNVRSGAVSGKDAAVYAAWLGKRFSGHPNIIWLNGGDVRGTDSMEIWNVIGQQLKRHDPAHLVTFHPFGRTQSSDWFHDASWLDFHMFQSGHRRYDQDDTERAYGEDNWRYALHDLALEPARPTLDGEPSYEDIPQGLHDTSQPRWKDSDLRRYAYWSVFSGCAGFTYGHNSVMQFYDPAGPDPAYGARLAWLEALQAPGAVQMQYLKRLMLSRSYLSREPDSTLVAGDQGAAYNYLAAIRGTDHVMIYTYTGREIPVRMGVIGGERIRASWFDPRTGRSSSFGRFENSGVHTFDPPGEVAPGNDWVLVLQ